MGSVMLSIGEFARLGGVSPRMLRHYDELGLLTPERVDPRPVTGVTGSRNLRACTAWSPYEISV